jgi:hypothetical protein
MDTLFDNNNIIPDFDDTKNWYEELVGETKKFKSNEDLAKGKAESDRYIKTLEQQKDEIRNMYLSLKEQVDGRAKLEDLIDRIEKGKTRDSEDSTTPEDKEKTPIFDLTQIKNMITQERQEADIQERSNRNYAEVQRTLKEKFGPRVNEVLKEKMDTLMIDDAYLVGTAKRSPQAFYSLMGLTEQPQSETMFQAPPRTTQRPTTFSNQNDGARTLAYYEKMRETNPKAYLDPKIQVQMDKDSQALGVNFFDVD